MRQDEGENKRVRKYLENIRQLIGEFLAICPIFIVSYFIGLLPQALLSAMLIFIFKLFYKDGYHTPKGKEYICILITYFTMILSLAVAYLFKGEYFTQIIFISIVCFINAWVGEWQVKSGKFDIIYEPYNRLRNDELKRQTFDIHTCTVSQLRECCRLKRLSPLLTERAIKLYIYKQSIEKVAFSEHVEIDTIYKSIQRINNKLS